MQGIAQSMSRKLQSRVPRSTSQKTRLKSRVPSGRKERQKSAIQLPPSSGILLINTGDAAENKKISTTKENQANVKVQGQACTAGRPSSIRVPEDYRSD